MQLFKTCSCSVLFGILVPYFLLNNDKNEKILSFYINSTKLVVPYPENYEKFRDIVNYSTIGAISGMIIGSCI